MSTARNLLSSVLYEHCSETPQPFAVCPLTAVAPLAAALGLFYDDLFCKALNTGKSHQAWEFCRPFLLKLLPASHKDAAFWEFHDALVHKAVVDAMCNLPRPQRKRPTPA